MMKCYVVEDPNAYEFGLTTVFAETASKARYAASLNPEMEGNSRDEFLHYLVHRLPQGDRFYKQGKGGLDWDAPEERLVMVQELGWYCSDEFTVDELGCETCIAREFCGRWELHG